jgi:DNA invertase Pin-like site-specific DNA recombinase
MIIGYARVSDKKQNVENQIPSLEKYGCSKIFQDIMSGKHEKTLDRKGMWEAVNFVREGDTLVVWKLDRMGRSLKDLLEILEQLDKKKVVFHSLTEAIHVEGPFGKLIIHFMGALAEFEREQMLERQRAGIQWRKSQGIGGTRPFKMNKESFETFLDLLQSKSIRQACKILRVSPASVYRYMDRNEIARESLQVRKGETCKS